MTVPTTAPFFFLAVFAGNTIGACATSTHGGGDLDTDVVVMDVVIERCKVPELKAFFSFGTARITKGHQNLDALASCLVSGPLRNERLRLIGRTDSVGTPEYNQKLGLWRAKSVGEYLIRKGVDSGRIEYRSRGHEGATDRAGRGAAEDRRVDIQILLL